MSKPRLALVEVNDSFIHPDRLHKSLRVTQTQEITFSSERHMRSYRGMLYDINRQGQFRYRTIRSEGSMWSILVWRMK